MVRGLGPGVPLRALVAGRRRLRQGADRAPAQDALPAPERPDPRVRVELQRRQPAGDCRGRRYSCTSARPRSGAPATIEFLARVFDRLITNFTWWVNRKDPDDRNLFQGGFLGLDNIGVFDRSAPLPGGGTLEQADGTAWMALYCQWMLAIAVELAKFEPAYADMGLKFISHFMFIAVAMNPPRGDIGLWDEEDGFYYDVMRMPDGDPDPAEGALSRGVAPTLRRYRVRARDARPLPGATPAASRFHQALLGFAPGVDTSAGRESRGPADLAAGRRGPPEADPHDHARRERVPRRTRHPGDLAPPPRAPVRVRLGRSGATTCTTFRRSPTPGCSAATRTGAARSGSP